MSDSTIQTHLRSATTRFLQFVSKPHPLLTIIVPAGLFILSLVSLVIHSDLNLPLLFSQCHAHARLGGLSRIPLVGPVACYIISFLQFTTASNRGVCIMASILSFLLALTTVMQLESVRLRSSVVGTKWAGWLISRPTLLLLVANVLPALAWQGFLIPAFMTQTATVLAEDRRRGSRESWSGDIAEAVAIPFSIAVGFVTPAAIWLATGSPWAVAAWLLAPVWINGLRYIILWVIAQDERQLVARYVADSRTALIVLYFVPVATSMVAHWGLVWSYLRHDDDRGDVTKSTTLFLQVEAIWTFISVGYWVIVEVGWAAGAVLMGGTVVGGPGAGICATWVYRECVFGGFDSEAREPADDEESDRGSTDTARPGEHTPLLG